MFEENGIPQDLLDMKIPQQYFYRVIVTCPIENDIANLSSKPTKPLVSVTVFETDDSFKEIKEEVKNIEKNHPYGFIYEKDFGKLITNTTPINRWCVFDIDGNPVEEV